MLVRPEAIDYPPPETLPAVMDSIINEQVIAFHRTVVQAKDEATGVLSLAADEAAMLLPEHMRRNQYLRLAAACRQTDTIGSVESQAIAAISKTVELARSTVLIGRAVEAMHLNKYRPEIHGAAIEKASRHWDDEHRRRLSQKEAMTWDTMAEVASRSVSTAVGCKQIIEILQPRQPLLRRQLLRAVDVLDKLDRGQTIDPKADLSPICELTEEIFSDNRYRQRQAVQSADEVLRDKIGTVIAERVKRYKQQGDERRSAAYNGLIIAMGGKVIEPSSTPTTAKNTPQVELQLTAQAKHRHSRRSSRPPKPAVQPTATTEESAPKVIWNPRGVAAATALLATAAGIAAPASAASAPAASETAATVHYANPEATALPTAQKDLRTIVIKQPVAPGAIEQQPTMPAKVAQPPETIQMPSSHDVPKSQNASVPETTVVQPTPGETSTTTVPTTDTPTTPAQGPEQTDAPTNGNGDPQT
ncbi:MAG TPA: hypothetical protein VFH39_00960, partial [Candidatus Saccharimonadales bacterium]|nr:hypothetical protein [Candidatus Saccharimonadales bacterium]